MLPGAPYLVHRQNDDEVDNGSDQDEVDSSVDDCTEVNEGSFVAFLDEEAEAGDIRGAEGSDQRLDEVLGESGHDGGECATDDDCDGEVNNVAAHDEIFKTLKQGVLLGVAV